MRIAGLFLGVSLVIMGHAFGQTAGTMALSGPSTGGAQITPGTINSAVNGQLSSKANATNPTITGGTITGTNVTASTVQATGGIAPVTLTKVAQKVLTVDDFKCVAVAGSCASIDPDDTLSFTRYAAYLRAQIGTGNPQHVFALGFGNYYHVVGPIDWTGFAAFDFQGNGSSIYITNGPYAGIDMLGTTDITLENLKLFCGTNAVPCTNGIQIGRFSMSQGYPQNTFMNVDVDCYCTQADLFNNGSEVFTNISPYLVNRYTTNPAYALIQDGIDHWGMTSTFKCGGACTLSTDVFLSFNDSTYLNPKFFNLGAGSTVWMAGSHSDKYINGYILQSSTTAPAVVMYFASGLASSQSLLEWDMHSETAPTAEFEFVGFATPQLFGLRYENNAAQASASIFQAGAGVTGAIIYNADIRIENMTSGTAHLFDQPAKWAFGGTLFLPSTKAAAFNGPSNFSGTIETDNRTSFLAAATMATTGQYRLCDPTGCAMNAVATSGLVQAGNNSVNMGSDAGNGNINMGAYGGTSTPHIDLFGSSFSGVNARIASYSAGAISLLGQNGAAGTVTLGGGNLIGVNGLTETGTATVGGLVEAGNNSVNIGADPTNGNINLGINSSAGVPHFDIYGNSYTGVSTRFLFNAPGQITIEGKNNTGGLLNIGAIHLGSNGGTALATPSPCGTSPTFEGNSTDTDGVINTGGGSPTSCTIAFANAFLGVGPRCTFATNSTSIWASAGTRSTTSIQINFSAGFTGQVTYHCVQ